MKITVANTDKQQAAWLVENTPEITIDTLAEMLLARHIAEGGGPIPAWARRKGLTRGRYLRVVHGALLDHVDASRKRVEKRTGRPIGIECDATLASEAEAVNQYHSLEELAETLLGCYIKERTSPDPTAIEVDRALAEEAAKVNPFGAPALDKLVDWLLRAYVKDSTPSKR